MISSHSHRELVSQARSFIMEISVLINRFWPRRLSQKFQRSMQHLVKNIKKPSLRVHFNMILNSNQVVLNKAS